MPLSPLAALCTLVLFGLNACAADAPPSANASAASPAVDYTPPEQPDAAGLELVLQQYGELRQMQALDQRCDWLDPAGRAALLSTVEERHAWLKLWDVEESRAGAAAKDAIDRNANMACDSAQGRELQAGIHFAAWQMRVTWALRGQAVLPAADRPDWFEPLSPTASHAALLNETTDELTRRYDLSIQQARPAIGKEAETMLALSCTQGQPACPMQAIEPKFQAYATAWLQGAASYADALAGVEDKIGTPER